MNKNGSIDGGSTNRLLQLCNIDMLIFNMILIGVFLLTLLFFGIFVKLNYVQYAILCVFIIIGLLLYVYIAPHNFIDLTKKNISGMYTNLIISLFMLSFCSSLIFLHEFESFYNKSVFYYFLVGICASCLFLLSFNKNDYMSKILPFLVVLLALNIFLSNYIVFPTGTYASGDTHFQTYNLVLPMINDGKLPLGNVYTFFPNHQIYVASISIITNLNPVLLYRYLDGIIYGVVSLFFYLLGNRLFNKQVSILCSILYMLSPDVVYHATHAYQFSYAAPIGVLVLFLTLFLSVPEEGNERISYIRVKFVTLLILLTFALIWIHQFTSAVIYALILLEVVILNVFCILRNIRPALNKILLIYVLLMLTHWMYVSARFSKIIDVLNVYSSSLLASENYQAATMLSQVSSSSAVPFSIQFFEILGTGILFAFVIIGAFYGLRSKNIHIFIMASWGLVIWVLVGAGRFIEMPLILGTRLLTIFWMVSIAPLASLGIILFIEKFKTKGLIICCALIIVLSISNLGSINAGSETSVFAEEQTHVKLYDTERDILSRLWITNNVPLGSHIETTESWIPQYLDSNKVYSDFFYDVDEGSIVIDQMNKGEYFTISYLVNSGLRIRGIEENAQISAVKSGDLTTVEAKQMYTQIVDINSSVLFDATDSLNKVYTNGELTTCFK